MTTINELPRATCHAHLKDIIQAAAAKGQLAVGPIAQWPDGRLIEIAGRIQLRDFWYSQAVRWLCAAERNKGLFGKGYVEFFDTVRISHLPLTK